MPARRPLVTPRPATHCGPRRLFCALAPTFTALLALLLAACSGPVDTVREAHIAPDESVSIEQALKRYPYFKKITWSTFTDSNGKCIVQAACDIDVAANCREVSQAGLKLAQRDVTRDYFLARFVVDGLPARVRALEAMHVTTCSNGAQLVMADPKYLRAIYNREQVRFFCLDGLNCPGQGVSDAAAASPAPPAP